MAFADVFNTDAHNCNQILNAGSILLVGAIDCLEDEPEDITLTLTVAASSGAVTLNLTTSDTKDTRLRKGSVLHFGAGKAVVTADTLVVTGSTATPVPVEPLSAAIAINTTAKTWALLQILSPTNLPTNIESQEEDRTDLSYDLRGSMVKTKIELNPQISVINRKDDRALYEYIFKGAKSDTPVYALIVRSSTIHSFGKALINGWNDDGAVSAISKPQFTIKYQGNWQVTPVYEYLTTTEKAALNNIRQRSGLNILV